MLKIKHGSLVMQTLEEKNLYIENGKIAAITAEELSCDEELDAKGCYICPGFIDTHVHGGGGFAFMDGGLEPIRQAAKAHLLHGTTTICPTSMTASFEDLKQMILDCKALSLQSGKDGLPNFAGLHLEGPYIAPTQAGAQPPAYIYPPKEEEYRELLAIGEGQIRKWTFAPELPGAAKFCDVLVSHGVLPSMGHTDGTYEDVLRCHEHGANWLTHFYSSMSTITRKDGFRVPGVIEAGYALEGLHLEVIADGCHIPPVLLSMLCKIKGPQRVVLITDAVRGMGLPEGASWQNAEGEDQRCVILDGVAKLPALGCFAGSVASSDRLIRTMVKQVGLPVPLAVSMLTKNPAEMLGLREKGELKVGYDADLVFLNENFTAEAVMLGGKIIKNQL
ncbi:MAG: N-acetylglucosamine-6-phosphate deacetylase [Oscillospiraceae bacterium]|nr:N-acetylglucosamine-6-phosphate deacetylase [Oscillospiraceae bacterium]